MHHGVAFGVHTGHVQWVVTTTYAQKTRALLESFGPQSRDTQQLLAVGERAMVLAPTHHRLRHVLGQARHLAQQRHAGGVEVHAHRVHTVLHHGVQAACEFIGVHIMLVLPHPNGFGVDLHQLGQGVLQTSGNAGGTTQGHIHIGHFLAGQFAGAVHRSPRFADHHFLHSLGLRQFGQLGD